MSYEAFSGYPEVEIAIKAKELPLGYDIREATLVALKPDELFCYSISGASRTGKTNAIMLLAVQSLAAGHDMYLIDENLGKLSSFAKEHSINYIKTADEVFDFLEKTIVPEFTRRNKKIKEAGGRKYAAKAMADENQIIILIHSFGDFLSAVYSDTRDMHGFLEAMVKSGDEHKVTLFAVITSGDSSMHSTRPLYTGFTSWKTGIHLGGQVDNQRILEFDMTHAERAKKLPSGTGHIVHDDKVKTIIMPEL
jgi:S-DNA-T family DNA segregation ATPase FtsK/SpoIIIE